MGFIYGIIVMVGDLIIGLLDIREQYRLKHYFLITGAGIAGAMGAFMFIMVDYLYL